MANRPIDAPLPADLPENWTAGQIVAPDGTSVGLSPQHGYNYLMEQVNRAQQGVNAVNEAFENVSGKRTCSVVVGTSTAGWTAADCDFLCDGTDDQVEINQAIALLKEHGGELAILAGEYTLSANMEIANMGADVAITGNAGATVLNLSGSFDGFEAKGRSTERQRIDVQARLDEPTNKEGRGCPEEDGSRPRGGLPSDRGTMRWPSCQTP